MFNLKNCYKCKKILNQKFITANGKNFHPECFVCSECKKKINGEFNISVNDFFHPECYKKKLNLFCTVCKKELDKTWVSSGSRKYHESCYKKFIQLKCKICNNPIDGEYNHDDEGNYHVQCYKDKKAIKCNVCTQIIEGKYIYDSWGNKSHLKHDNKEVVFCSCCYRIISQNTSKNFIKYQDSRIICGFCQETEIIEVHQTVEPKIKVVELLKTVGFNYIPQMIKVTLDNKININKMLGTSITSNTHGYTKTTTNLVNGKIASRVHEIWMLYGMPKLLFEGVLAHELLHVWINENKIKLSHEEEEGFCNLGTALVYENDKSLFSEVLLKALDEDSDKVYGDGYRLMKKRLKEKGWKNLF
ncbi:MAG: protein DA1 [Candidatus Sericytochromatia bacterium]